MKPVKRYLKSTLNKLLVFILAIFTFFLGFWSTIARAQPPFITESPEPVDYQTADIYIFGDFNRARHETNLDAPAFDIDYGIFPNAEFHLLMPIAQHIPRGNDEGGKKTVGLGDIEVGFLYRFIQEDDCKPQVGIFPMFELPTGNSKRDLGNGRLWYQVPLAIQKSWKDWTVAADVGPAINHADGKMCYWFSGLLIQRKLSEALVLGAEVFFQGATEKIQIDDDGGTEIIGSTTTLNFGGTYNFTPKFGCTFSIGHTVGGPRHFMGGISLVWTVGDKKEDDKPENKTSKAKKTIRQKTEIRT